MIYISLKLDINGEAAKNMYNKEFNLHFTKVRY